MAESNANGFEPMNAIPNRMTCHETPDNACYFIRGHPTRSLRKVQLETQPPSDESNITIAFIPSNVNAVKSINTSALKTPSRHLPQSEPTSPQPTSQSL